MDQTIGKRIAQNRKRLGLTQDQLAEKLGVTAQAVSKWENDQSCPDIATLPKLAEIFGVSTDSLLGRDAPPPVREAEVVTEENEPEGFHYQKGNWEFRWDSGKKGSLAFAVLVLLVGGLLLAGSILNWEVSFWGLLWPSALLVFGLAGLFPRFSFISLGCFLFGVYFLADELNILPFQISGSIVFPAILVLFGISLLADALRKPKKPKCRIVHNGNSAKHKSHCAAEGEHFECSTSFGEDSQYITLPRLRSGSASVSFGELTVDLSGCEEIAAGCTIDASCSFGELKLLVPRQYRVEHSKRTAFASIDVQGQSDPNAQQTIYVEANVSFGEISIRYI